MTEDGHRYTFGNWPEAPWKQDCHGGSERAWEIHRQIVALKTHAEETFIILGRAIYEFAEIEGWRKLGYRSFGEYLADPEVNLTERTAYRLKAVYEKFVQELGWSPSALLPAGVSKLEMIRPYVDNQNAGEMIALASELSRSDLEIELGRRFRGEREPEWCKCPLCGRVHRRK